MRSDHDGHAAPATAALSERGKDRGKGRAQTPTAHQVDRTRAAVRWYVENHYGRPGDPGTLSMFTDPSRLGPFAIPRKAVLKGDGAALFRLLVAVTMFQRRQDVQIAAILRSLRPDQAAELTDLGSLLAMVDACPCEHSKTTGVLAAACDLAKDPVTKEGLCASHPGVECHMKRHTVWMRRYGHFGKVPSSAALVVREAGARDLADLLRRSRRGVKGPTARAEAAADAISRAWRISDKISAMFLSLIANPDLTPGVSGWDDVDWRHFIVIDSNVDLFLAAIRYQGAKKYEARRSFIRALADAIDLRAMNSRLRRNNPRIIQQAMFLFMSASNRRSLGHDCMHRRPDSCASCPKPLADLCPVRDAPLARRRLPILGNDSGSDVDGGGRAEAFR